MSVEVFFFGGYLASPTDVHDWAATAKAQQPGIDFTAYHWHEKDKEQKAIAAIKASRADAIYVVHSSGCANANAVDRAAVGNGPLGSSERFRAVSASIPPPGLPWRKRASVRHAGAVARAPPRRLPLR